MFCPECGNEVKDELLVCPNCGAKLDSVAVDGEELKELIRSVEASDFFPKPKLENTESNNEALSEQAVPENSEVAATELLTSEQAAQPAAAEPLATAQVKETVEAAAEPAAPKPTKRPEDGAQRAAQPGTARAAQPGAARAAQPGAARAAQPGAARPAQPGAARPAQPGAARAAQPGTARPTQAGAARQPVSQNGRKPEKKKKRIGLIVLILCLCLIFIALLVGGFMFLKSQRERQEATDAFRLKVEDFEDVLASAEYDSIRTDMAALFDECEKAVEEKAVESFDDLVTRMENMKLEAQILSEKITSMEELKSTYEALFNSKYKITAELRTDVEDVFGRMQSAIDAGEPDSMEAFRTELEALEEKLKEANIAIVEDAKKAVEALDLEDMTDAEKNSLDLYLEQMDKYLADGDYKNAVEKAGVYEAYANQVVEAIAQRLEESIQESIRVEAERKKAAEEAAKKKAEEEAKNQQNGSYICPGSNTRYLTEADLAGLSAWELLLARNEIYARHGRKFKDSSIQAYFNSQSWYKGTVDPADFDPSVFNAYEEANIDFIKAHE